MDVRTGIRRTLRPSRGAELFNLVLPPLRLAAAARDAERSRSHHPGGLAAGRSRHVSHHGCMLELPRALAIGCRQSADCRLELCPRISPAAAHSRDRWLIRGYACFHQSARSPAAVLDCFANARNDVGRLAETSPRRCEELLRRGNPVFRREIPRGEFGRMPDTVSTAPPAIKGTRRLTSTANT
jgi:hypothetical protein